MLLETKIDHCPSRHQPIIFIKECDNCDRWSVEAPAVCRVQVLARHQAGYLCALCWAGTHRRSVCYRSLATERLEPRLNYVAINIPPPTLQLGSAAPQSWHWYTEDYTSEIMPRSLRMLSHFQHLLKLNLSVVDLCYGGWHLNQTSHKSPKVGK